MYNKSPGSFFSFVSHFLCRFRRTPGANKLLWGWGSQLGTAGWLITAGAQAQEKARVVLSLSLAATAPNLTYRFMSDLRASKGYFWQLELNY